MMFWRKRCAETAADANESAQAKAARWLARRELGLLRSEEAAALQRWREQPDNEAWIGEIEATLEEVKGAATTPGIMRMREEALSQRPRGPLLLGNLPAGIAALVLAAVLVVAFMWRAPGGEMSASHSVAPATEVTATTQSPVRNEIYETQKGQTRAIKLTDGSLVTLNTASRVEVSLTAERRSLRLLSGQALFDVAHDPQRPFVVAVGPVNVTALGTQFDIRLQPEGARVVLLQGRVKVEPLTRQGLARLVPMLARHDLESGEQLLAGWRQDVTVSVADVERATSWRQGRLVFRGDALEEAVAEFNRYSDQQITVADPAIARLPVSGVFATAHPENFVAAVVGFYNLQVEQRGPHLQELRSRSP
ncbi:FecR family protein [Steroidobacter sp.]|uniref:FecR family protein n=1 Tax=Steroidobacter sp. TaxID=1978227 RepID=UPI001A561517|nr:FecR domain-containing protein [Steroidobacter sp.]MBL8267895.1 FecR domain-containing protein [Steroidobacter sp.]